MPSPLSGKSVIVTGASSGIGREIGTLLASRGAAVALAARRGDRIDALARSIVSAGGQTIAVPTDVTSLEDVHHLVNRTIREFGRVDVLVNNAGVARLGRLDTPDVESWTTMVDVNFRGLLHTLAATLPVFRKQGSGHVITTVSTAGLTVSPTMAVYAATKNAARTVMEGLRTESTDNVIRTTEISPGFVQTELADNMTPETRDQIQTQMRTLGLPPEAVAKAVSFAIEHPQEVEISSLTIRPTAQP